MAAKKSAYMRLIDDARTSFCAGERQAYSWPASLAAWATLSLRVPEACWFWIQSVKYSCHADGASFGGRSTDLSARKRSDKRYQ